MRNGDQAKDHAGGDDIGFHRSSSGRDLEVFEYAESRIICRRVLDQAGILHRKKKFNPANKDNWY
jgi:hypothetical protein